MDEAYRAAMDREALRQKLVKALHEADGLLSLVAYRHASGLPEDLPHDLLIASAKCRSLARELDQ